MEHKHQNVILIGLSLLACTVVGCQSTPSADPAVTNAELLKAIQELQTEMRILRGDVQAMAPVQPDPVEREIARLREQKRKLKLALEEMLYVNTMTDKHPSVVTLKRKIAFLDQKIQKQVESEK